MRKYFRNQLLMQVDMLRWIISHEELSVRLGDATEHCLARYIAGRTHLRQDEFEKIAKAFTIHAQMLAQAWALSLGVRLPEKDAVSRMIDRAHRHWRRHSRLAARRVPPSPSPMTVIRAKYADRLPQQTPPLWFNSLGDKNLHERAVKDSPVPRKCWSSSSMPSNHSAMSEQCTGSVEYRLHP